MPVRLRRASSLPMQIRDPCRAGMIFGLRRGSRYADASLLGRLVTGGPYFNVWTSDLG